MTRHSQYTRRAVLRALGAAVALPYLETTQAVIAGKALGANPTSEMPTRMAFFFVPNGVNLNEWTPVREGYGYDLPSILEPLHRVQDDVNVMSGLTHDKGRANGDGAGDHARSASVFLTGSQPRKTSAGDLFVGTSVDQIPVIRGDEMQDHGTGHAQYSTDISTIQACKRSRISIIPARMHTLTNMR